MGRAKPTHTEVAVSGFLRLDAEEGPVTHYKTDEFEPGDHPGAVMARLAEPTAATETTLAVVADPHVGKRSEGTSKLFDRTETHFRNALAD